MDKQELNNEQLKINNYLKSCARMNFEFTRMNGGEIIVVGKIDRNAPTFAITITFDMPYYISTLLFWELDPTKPFIEVSDGKEEQIINDTYQIEQGNHLFKMNAKHFTAAPIMIASHKLKCEIIEM